jgi:hypothetical protein
VGGWLHANDVDKNAPLKGLTQTEFFNTKLAYKRYCDQCTTDLTGMRNHVQMKRLRGIIGNRVR